MTSYLLDPCGNGRPGPVEDATVVLVGCGGTGAYLAEAVCRLLIGRQGSLHLVDHDRVEPHNVARQAFDDRDVGKFKAQVLAERLARRFRRVVGYSVAPYDADLHGHVFGELGGLRLLVGAVDNAAARRAIAATLDGGRDPFARRPPTWWMDLGNGRNSGQVLLGSATRRELLRGAFDPESGLCRALPAPSLQRPDLLEAPPAPAPRLDCAEAVAAEEQSGTVNQVVAALGAAVAERLLGGTCGWSAVYFDVDDGLLRCVAAEPRAVAQVAGLRPDAVAPRARRAA
jgi:PRTRC genetic system ThiF family protein